MNVEQYDYLILLFNVHQRLCLMPILLCGLWRLTLAWAGSLGSVGEPECLPRLDYPAKVKYVTLVVEFITPLCTIVTVAS